VGWNGGAAMSAAEVIDFERLHQVIPGLLREEREDATPAPDWQGGLFPPDIDAYIGAQARSIRVPVEMVAVPMMVMAGSTLGNRLSLSLKRGWNERPTLWAGVISPPGTAKTPAMLAAQWAINEIQKELVEQYQRELAEYESDLERWSEQAKGKRGAKPVRPRLQHIYTSDATIEALVGILSETQGVAFLVDELLSWIMRFDAYRGGKGGDRQQWLSLWSGSPIKADRKGADTVYCANPVAGIYGGIQPDMMRKLHNPDGGRDGLVERVLLYYPDVTPARWTDDDVDPVLLDPVKDIYRHLHNIGSPDHRFRVSLSREAKSVFTDWYNDLQDQVETSSGLRRGFLSKMPSHVARVALILNTLWNLDDPQRLVSERRMLDAIAVGEYFIAHLDRVLPLIGDSSRTRHTGLAGRIMRILKRESNEMDDGWVRRAMITKRLGNVQSDDLSDALDHLQRVGEIESRTIKTSTKPAEEWRIKPEGQGYQVHDEEVIF
jgi:hypothetical protein